MATTGAGANTTQSLNGLFYEIYAKNIQDLIPDGVKLLKLVPFIESERETGNRYN